MRAAVFRGAFDIRVEQIPDASILEPTDAIIRITHACICGTDLWPYRGQGPYTPGWQIGHEWMGMVEDVGPDVRTIKRGDRVIAPYDFCDGTCEFCCKGLDSACQQGGVWGYGHEGGQAEAIRARFADATLVALPTAVEGDEALLKALLPLTDNMAAGHHAAVSAGGAPRRNGGGDRGWRGGLMCHAGSASTGSRTDHRPGTSSAAPRAGSPVWGNRCGHEQRRAGGPPGHRDDRRGCRCRPGVRGNRAGDQHGGEYDPSWWNSWVCGGPTWQWTDPAATHVFLQYRRAWRAGSGARLSSRAACRGACRSA